MESRKWTNRAAAFVGVAAVCLLAAVPSGGALLFDGDDAMRWRGPGNVQKGPVLDGMPGAGFRADKAGDTTDRADYLFFDLDAHPMDPDEGTIRLSLVRNEESHAEALLSLTDGTGRRIWLLEILWDRGPAFYVLGDATILTPARVPLPHPVARGQSFEVTLSWSANSFKVLLDGKDSGIVPIDTAAFPSLIRKARYLLVGAETEPNRIPNGAWSQLGSLLTGIEVHGGVAPEAPSALSAVAHDAMRAAGFSGSLVAGDRLTVDLEGVAGGAASFDVARLANNRGKINLDWKGWGVYLEEKRFFDDDEVDLSEFEEYRVYARKRPYPVVTEAEAETALAEGWALVVSNGVTYRLPDEPLEVMDEVSEQEYLVEDLELDVPYYLAVVAVMDDGTIRPIVMPVQGVAMVESEVTPGMYQGVYEIAYADDAPRAVVVGHLASGDTVASAVADEFEIDTDLVVDVSVSAGELPADEKSTSKVTVTVTDANGDSVSGHEVRFVLATTSEYTGVVGGGAFADEVGGSLEREFWGETDLFGKVKAEYTAGFAAKTAIIVARDMVSNDVGSAYVKTFIQATAELELEATQELAGKALGYAITVTSSDEWLTADGESEARITALVTQDGSPVEGHRVVFAVTEGTGTIRLVRGVTGGDGEARAVYTAGKKIGVVLVTAVDTTVGISGSVQIELRSDAPAKIALRVEPDVLPADGHSKADVFVVVTDINDNPNEGVEVEYAIAAGSGQLRKVDPVTDKDGESSAEYMAGRVPGKVTIEVTVRSAVPTEEELSAAEDLALTPPDYDFF